MQSCVDGSSACDAVGQKTEFIYMADDGKLRNDGKSESITES